MFWSETCSPFLSGARIENAVKRSFIFKALDQAQLDRVILAMEEKVIPAHTDVIVQGAEVGDEDDGLYMLETGTMNVYKQQPGGEAPGAHVFTYANPGSSFGELALLYNCPRAATVKAVEDCTVWVLQRAAFNSLVKGSIMQKREMFSEFLCSVRLGTYRTSG